MNLASVLHWNLKNSMGSRRIDISAILSCHSNTSSELNNLHQILNTTNFPFRKSNDIDVIFCILPALKLENTSRTKYSFRSGGQKASRSIFHKMKSICSVLETVPVAGKCQLQPTSTSHSHFLHLPALYRFYRFLSVRKQSKKLWRHRKRSPQVVELKLDRSMVGSESTC